MMRVLILNITAQVVIKNCNKNDVDIIKIR